MKTIFDINRHARHLVLPELQKAGLERIRRAKILLIGAGGLGSPVAHYLVASGIGTLGIADGDRVEVSNLQRQFLHRTSTIHQLKVESARTTLGDLNPETVLKLHPFRVDASNVKDFMDQYDLVVEATDNFESKFLINDFCVHYQKPFVTAGIVEFRGQIMSWIPGKPCYRCLYPEPMTSQTPPPGVFSPLVGVLGSLQASEALKWAAGLPMALTDHLLTMEGHQLTFSKLKRSHADNCSLCNN